MNKQFQLDALGEYMLLLAAAARHDHLDSWHWRAAETAVAAIKARHGGRRRRRVGAGQPALGPFPADVRGRPALDRGGRGGARQAGDWEALADAILADGRAGLPARERALAAGARRSADRRRPAAARHPGRHHRLLTPAPWPPWGPFGSPSWPATGTCTGSATTSAPCMRRRGRSCLCGFLMALALQQQGREKEAAGWFERDRAACGPPGLLTEEFDVIQRQLRGNTPQAFVHALLFESAARLTRAWDQP